MDKINLKLTGVYKIQHSSGKVYVGSAIHISKRWKLHLKQLTDNCHHSGHLQKAWSKYGKDQFVFEILEVIENPTKEELLQREQYWLDYYKCYLPENGYNVASIAGSNLGIKRSEETKAKISKYWTGRPSPKKGIPSGIPSPRKDSWKKKVSEEELVSYYLKGNSLKDCKAKFGISIDSIRIALLQSNVMRTPTDGMNTEKARAKNDASKKGRIPWNKDNGGYTTTRKDHWKTKVALEDILKFYKEGNSIKKCVEHFLISEPVISRILHENKCVRTFREIHQLQGHVLTIPVLAEV